VESVDVAGQLGHAHDQFQDTGLAERRAASAARHGFLFALNIQRLLDGRDESALLRLDASKYDHALVEVPTGQGGTGLLVNGSSAEWNQYSSFVGMSLTEEEAKEVDEKW